MELSQVNRFLKTALFKIIKRVVNFLNEKNCTGNFSATD